MAREFKLLCVLGLVAACVVATTTTPTTTADPTTTTVVTTTTPTTTADPTTTTVATTTTPTTTTGPTTTTVATTTTPTTTTGPTTTTEAGKTTTAGPTTTTEAGKTTTAGPTTTTEAGKTTTAGPTTTTEAGKTTTAGPTTTTEAGKTTTAGPTTTAEAGKTTTAVPTTTKPGPCNGSPCGDGSTCLPRHNETFVCSCLAGNYNYGSGTCDSAKVFPGQLGLSKLPYDDAMADSASEAFQDAAQQISAEMSEVFDKGYSNCTVLKLEPIPAPKLWSRSKPGILATVEIIFKANAPIKETDIKQKLTEAGGVLGGANFTASNLCDEKTPCDADTAKCLKEDGSFTCKCMENYIKTDFSNRMCIACPSGTKAQGSEKCVDCPFGYSGFNCNESWKLSLVIVGSVFGGLLLIAVIVLPIVARKSSKKSSKKDKIVDTGKSYVSHPQDKKPLVNSGLGNSQAASFNGSANGLSAFANAGVPRIPRATTNNSWDSRTNLEMSQSNNRPNLAPVGRNPRLYDDHNDMNSYAQARPQNGLYAQSRPQNNPYAQTRPQINPYTQNQGHSNPYYMHDDGRRFN